MLPVDKNLMKTKSEPIRVIVRCRPMSSNEKQSGYSKIVNVQPSNRSVQVYDSSTDKAARLFEFDAVYDTISSQEDLYSESVLNIIDSVMRGYNATIFAYGQTGSGKTFTMEGSRDLKGIIPRSFEQIFSHVDRSTDCDFSVIATYVEIYNEEVRDLLDYNKSRQLCKLREDTETGVFVKNLSRSICKSVRDLERVMKVGNQNRQTGFTHMNEHSSRSHAILTITVEARRFDAKKIRTGKLNLVDLAGSERQSKTNSTDERLKEASKINLSLSALGNVISALGKKQRHIPYRDSKLTRLLQDSLGGNSRTLMIANIGPASYNYEETLMTLRYANRAKRITNRPSVNESDKDTMIKYCEEEIRRLKCMIAEKKMKAKRGMEKYGQSFESVSYENGERDYTLENKINIDDCSNEDDNPGYEFSDKEVENIERILNKTFTINDNNLNSLVQTNNKHNNHFPKKAKNFEIISQKENIDNKNLLRHIEHLNQISEAKRTEIEKAAEMELELKKEFQNKIKIMRSWQH
ncbi:kinesin-like protein KIF3B [Nilaparvata lugens]|uniref:kinesin-like protein KIF3B n=1 Tax=Nilaparvata lugens TaxID=108931 RepID=UPI00193E24D6|nr:kinesin-like protein KIF3B [Nilaparvata lugens]